MHAVYYKNQKYCSGQTPTITAYVENDHTAFTALTGSRFWSRHVLLSGPKPQNTNCTDMFSTAVMRHKQQTSGRLRTAQGVWNPTNDWYPQSKFH